ncbi:MAG: hypothetical protein IJ307_01615 [Bacteroidales bacterium]|nr:hypothetical protein [Bacteroidales bacterium]
MNTKLVTCSLAAVFFMALATVSCIFCRYECCCKAVVIADILFALIFVIAALFWFVVERRDAYASGLVKTTASLEKQISEQRESLDANAKELGGLNARIETAKEQMEDIKKMSEMDVQKVIDSLAEEKRLNAELREKYDDLARSVAPLLAKIEKMHE